jgi:hypothetical protein
MRSFNQAAEKAGTRYRWGAIRFKIAMVMIAAISVALGAIAASLLIEGGNDNTATGVGSLFGAVMGIGIVIWFVRDGAKGVQT